MRPAPVAAGFQACLPGSVSRVANPGSSAKAKRDTLSAMPLAVTDVMNVRREIFIVPRPRDLWDASIRGRRKQRRRCRAGTESRSIKVSRRASAEPRHRLHELRSRRIGGKTAELPIQADGAVGIVEGGVGAAAVE